MIVASVGLIVVMETSGVLGTDDAVRECVYIERSEVAVNK